MAKHFSCDALRHHWNSMIWMWVARWVEWLGISVCIWHRWRRIFSNVRASSAIDMTVEWVSWSCYEWNSSSPSSSSYLSGREKKNSIKRVRNGEETVCMRKWRGATMRESKFRTLFVQSRWMRSKYHHRLKFNCPQCVRSRKSSQLLNSNNLLTCMFNLLAAFASNTT